MLITGLLIVILLICLFYSEPFIVKNKNNKKHVITFGSVNMQEYDKYSPPNKIQLYDKRNKLLEMRLKKPNTYRLFSDKTLPDYNVTKKLEHQKVEPNLYDEINGNVSMYHKPYVQYGFNDHILPCGPSNYDCKTT
jgi:hypothetical protein